jgi:hypothetical protein
VRRLVLIWLAVRHGVKISDMLVTAGTALHFADENRTMFEDWVADGRPMDSQERAALQGLMLMAHRLVTPHCAGFGTECDDEPR